MKDPDLEWLERRWALPAEASDCVNGLLTAEASGSTAYVFDEAIRDWGQAATTAEAEARTPLVIVEWTGRTYLQSRRLFETERFLARQFMSRAQAPAEAEADSARLDALFPGAEPGNRQRRAAEVAATRRIALITGGPGTGKTYTLARILALICGTGIRPSAVRIAAPTGKAAERMKRAIQESLEHLPPDFEPLRPALGEVAGASGTIHSLIGYNPGAGRARHDARSPLGCEVLVVDECSMIDAPLWRALLESLPVSTCLILLGDPNQLESVGQGNVFAELAKAAEWSALGDCHVHLTEARRFRDRPAIAEFSRALEESDADRAAAILKAGQPERGVAWIETDGKVFGVERFPAAIRDSLEAVAFAATPALALDALERVCVLTAQREFFVGAEAISAAVEASIARHGGVRNHPIIINRNDPETGLRNGSVGVIHAEPDGRRKAWFRGSSGGALREFSVARLPDYGPAWAITIHRSQGSEYDDVLVIVPRADSPLATRELLYTAVTRARRNVFVAGDLASIRKAVLTPSARTTLLAFHLRQR